MKQLGSGDGVYLGDGECLSWDEFGEECGFDVDEERFARLPVLEWEADMQHRYPRAERGVIRQFIRLSRATVEFWESSGRRLPVYGVLGELYASMVWGVSLHKTYNAQGSDGKIGSDYIEVKTIGPCSKNDRVAVKLSGHFTKLLVVRIEQPADASGLRVQSRLVERRALTRAKSGSARISWSRACEIGDPEPRS
jgi:hypothetical protein